MPLFGYTFLLAPMAEITTPILRSLIRSFTPDVLLCSEMLSAHLLLHGGIINKSLIAKEDGEKIIYQILGNNPDEMSAAAEYLESLLPWGIDINMGCSAPDILKSRSGAYLLKETDLARSIIRRCRQSVKGKLSVKIRAGFQNVDYAFTKEFCRMIADEGADFITIHPRAAKQGFRGAADWKVIHEIKQTLSIPVVGNGDITDSEAALTRLGTGVDAVMIGRAAAQKPWIFAECAARLSEKAAATSIDLASCALAILDGIRHTLPEEVHKTRAHRFLFYFTKNFSFGHPLFTSIRNESAIDIMKTLVSEYLERNPGERFVESVRPCQND
jgi:nifR3 family TIM-barrel protein